MWVEMESTREEMVLARSLSGRRTKGARDACAVLSRQAVEANGPLFGACWPVVAHSAARGSMTRACVQEERAGFGFGFVSTRPGPQRGLLSS